MKEHKGIKLSVKAKGKFKTFYRNMQREMVLPSHYLPIITLHANNTNSTIKRYDWPIYRLLTNNTPHKDATK